MKEQRKRAFLLPITHREHLSTASLDNHWIIQLLEINYLTERSIHLVRSISGRLSHLTFLFLHQFLFFITLGWTYDIPLLSQAILAKLTFLISVSCSRENPTPFSFVSYQKRSPFLKFLKSVKCDMLSLYHGAKTFRSKSSCQARSFPEVLSENWGSCLEVFLFV